MGCYVFLEMRRCGHTSKTTDWWRGRGCLNHNSHSIFSFINSEDCFAREMEERGTSEPNWRSEKRNENRSATANNKHKNKPAATKTENKLPEITNKKVICLCLWVCSVLVPQPHTAAAAICAIKPCDVWCVYLILIFGIYILHVLCVYFYVVHIRQINDDATQSHP